MEENKFYLTAEAVERLKAELTECEQVRRPEILKDLEYARSLGDLSENADYDAARSAQSENEAKIKEIRNKLDNYILISKEGDIESVTIGCKVTFKNEKTNEVRTITITGDDDANPIANMISNTSALGKALLDRKVDDTCHVECKNDYKVTILEISR